MANPAPTINQIDAFNATQGTTIDFNIIGGTELVRSNRIYIYDLSDNSLICTHLYVSTESIHELPANTDGSIVYESGKSSADFVNGAQYYAQIQTFTDIAGTEGGSGLSVAKMFWCLVDPTLTITTIPSTISTTSYNISATYNANTSVVSNIIQQYQFSLYSATGSLLQSSGVVVGSGTQQGTSTTYDISYNFTGLSVGSSYYVVVEVTTTQGMSVSAQSNTFTVSIDTPTLGEATVVNNACDGYISVTSNLSSEYGGSGSGEIVSFETDSENVFTKLQVDLDPIQDLHGYDKPWVGGAGANKWDEEWELGSIDGDTGQNTSSSTLIRSKNYVTILSNTSYYAVTPTGGIRVFFYDSSKAYINSLWRQNQSFTTPNNAAYLRLRCDGTTYGNNVAINYPSTVTTYSPYSNICPISGHDDVDVVQTGKNLFDITDLMTLASYATEVSNGYNFYSSAGLFTTGVKCKFPLEAPITLSMDVVNETGKNLRFRVWYTDGTVQSLNDSGSGQGDGGHVSITVYRDVMSIGLDWSTSGFFTVTNMQIEFGEIETDYEPYTAEEIHKDIEATYTPTVQENESYQFKRTGDVGGDRESIELVGGSVAWNQIFEDNQYWDAAGGTVVDNDGVLTITSSGNANCYYRYQKIDVMLPNHVYLISGDIKLDSGNANEYPNTTLLISWSGGYAVKSNPPKGSWGNVSAILKPTVAASVIAFYVFGTASTQSGEKAQLKNRQLIDLTQMFGSTIADYIYTLEQGQAGAGVAFFRKYFPKPYYPYDSGTIKSVEGVSAHKTVGFNAWDEEWENGYLYNGEPFASDECIRSKNYCPCVPNSLYYCHCGSATTLYFVRVVFYDANHNYISAPWTSNRVFTSPVNASYFKISTQSAEGNKYGGTYKNDICINLSWDGERNGEYEPYVEHSYPLDDSLTLRGIPKVANGKLYYDGDTYRSDGLHTERFELVDLGSITPTKYDVAQGTLFRFPIGTTIKKSVDTATLPNIICAKYVTVTNASRTNKTISMANNTEAVDIIDNDYSSASAIQAAMNGVYLLYERATPTTETAQPFESIQKVTPNYGTEEFVTDSIVPVGNNTQYYTRGVYGGTLDLVSGVLTVTKVCIDLGDLNYDYSNGVFISYVSVVDLHTKERGGYALSSIYTQSPSTSASSMANYSVQITGGLGDSNFWIKDSRFTSASDFKTAMNGVQLVYELATPLTYQLTPQQIQTLVGVNNVWSEQGNVELSYHIPITNLLVKRQDVADVSGSWLTLYSQPITQASDMDFTFIDFTNQYGKTYKYALVPLLTQTQSGVEVEVEGGYTVSDEVQSVFDGVFIADSTGSQKCKANVGYGNVDMNQVVGSITPIGAKYPIVITNSKNQYHNGSISGTIVPDDYYFNGNLSRIDMVNKRNELEQFLTNKRAKIIKDWNGNIWLVMIIDNVSCTFNNNYGMGIVNFNTNWVEVGDPTNQQDLQATGLINVGGV